MLKVFALQNLRVGAKKVRDWAINFLIKKVRVWAKKVRDWTKKVRDWAIKLSIKKGARLGKKGASLGKKLKFITTRHILENKI